jgi:transcriptional regulator with XRE-family HTH domain
VKPIGPTLRAARKRRKLTLRETAGLAGIALATLSGIENDKLDPRLSTVRKLSATLGIRAQEWFE